MMTTVPSSSVTDLAQTLRAHALRMVHRTNASHIGTCLSMADLLAVLYGRVLRVDVALPEWAERDRFILSKGHGAAILYAVLAELGFFPIEQLDTYCQDGSKLTGHINHGVAGVEVSTGSLGHGLSIGCGIALAGKREGKLYRVYVLLSDGELDEGSNWDNLVAIVDYNKIQSFGSVEDVLDLHPLADKWRAFRWSVREIDGHDVKQIEDALTSAPFEKGRPSAIIAHTVKGRGISYMEDQLAWHYKSPNAEQLALALAELGVQE